MGQRHCPPYGCILFCFDYQRLSKLLDLLSLSTYCAGTFVPSPISLARYCFMICQAFHAIFESNILDSFDVQIPASSCYLIGILPHSWIYFTHLFCERAQILHTSSCEYVRTLRTYFYASQTLSKCSSRYFTHSLWMCSYYLWTSMLHRFTDNYTSWMLLIPVHYQSNDRRFHYMAIHLPLHSKVIRLFVVSYYSFHLTVTLGVATHCCLTVIFYIHIQPRMRDWSPLPSWA